jgi:RimJ/RimL family protein N-acetyltransferase
MPGAPFRHGDGVSLHTVEREDLAFLGRLRNDPAVRYGLTFTDPENDVRQESWFEDHVSETDVDDAGAQFVVVPRDESDGTGGDSDPGADDGEGPAPVGYVSLFDVERPAGHAHIAAAIAPEHQGRGYATAATRELVAYGIEELRLNKVVAGALVDNEASRAVLERVGFREGDRMREEKYVDGERVDCVRYSVLAEEWFDRPETSRGLPDRPPGATAAERGHDDPFAFDTGDSPGGSWGDDAPDRGRDDGGDA